MKQFLLLLWGKNTFRYGIEIIEFIIMDNHAHLIVKAQTVEGLGHFMRTVNSQLARYINKLFDRDSQAIKERYKSPVISNMQYCLKAIQYVWLNRIKEDKQSKPDQDPYCSASWRLNPQIICKLTKNQKEQKILERLLGRSEIFPESDRSMRKFVRDLLNAALSKMVELDDAVFECSHTIGDRTAVKYRSSLLGAFIRERIPWTPIPQS